MLLELYHNESQARELSMDQRPDALMSSGLETEMRKSRIVYSCPQSSTTILAHQLRHAGVGGERMSQDRYDGAQAAQIASNI